MKSIRFVLATLIACAVSLVLLSGNQETAQSAEEENHCFTCHTNSQKLIKITREIAAANKGKKAASSESEGEG
jgi:nitrate/TMAO reductase-like tetraheme cytochrome c subunit